MAAAWEQLAEEYDGHDTALVAEVNCQAGGKPLCDANDVRGYPTIKFGDPTALSDYQSGRSYEELASFAKANLKPLCSVKHIDLCDDDKKVLIENYMSMENTELKKIIKTEEKKVEKAKEDFKGAVARLQAEYQKLQEEKDETIAEIKASGLGLMKSVLTA